MGLFFDRCVWLSNFDISVFFFFANLSGIWAVCLWQLESTIWIWATFGQFLSVNFRMLSAYFRSTVSNVRSIFSSNVEILISRLLLFRFWLDVSPFVWPRPWPQFGWNWICRHFDVAGKPSCLNICEGVLSLSLSLSLLKKNNDNKKKNEPLALEVMKKEDV